MDDIFSTIFNGFGGGGSARAKNPNAPHRGQDIFKNISLTFEEAVFGVHEKTNRIMIKVLDKDTKEILKEFPPEKTLDMIASIWEMAGILVDQKM